MMLHLGVVDMPYSNGGKTTGDVAEILEAKYHIMETFYESHQADIAKMLADSLQGALDNVLMGVSQGNYPFNTSDSAIETAFRNFLTQREIEGFGIPGVPTQAALDGVSHRFKSKRGPRRPSFIDTGLYQSSAKVWVD